MARWDASHATGGSGVHAESDALQLAFSYAHRLRGLFEHRWRSSPLIAFMHISLRSDESAARGSTD